MISSSSLNFLKRFAFTAVLSGCWEWVFGSLCCNHSLYFSKTHLDGKQRLLWHWPCAILERTLNQPMWPWASHLPKWASFSSAVLWHGLNKWFLRASYESMKVINNEKNPTRFLRKTVIKAIKKEWEANLKTVTHWANSFCVQGLLQPWKDSAH